MARVSFFGALIVGVCTLVAILGGVTAAPDSATDDARSSARLGTFDRARIAAALGVATSDEVDARAAAFAPVLARVAADAGVDAIVDPLWRDARIVAVDLTDALVAALGEARR